MSALATTPLDFIALREQDDSRLVEAARRGDEWAFERIVARHRRGLVRQCARLVGEADAEEAVQEALLKAYEALRRGLAVRTLEPWLRTIAHNTAVNMLRARAVRPISVEIDCECMRGVDDSLQHRQELRTVLAAVQSLPQRQRQAIVMRELEGRSYEEIGARLGASHGAVRQLLNRGRIAIRERVAGLAALEPLTRWLGGSGAVSGGCAVTIKICTAAVLPVAIGGAAAVVTTHHGQGRVVHRSFSPPAAVQTKSFSRPSAPLALHAHATNQPALTSRVAATRSTTSTHSQPQRAQPQTQPQTQPQPQPQRVQHQPPSFQAPQQQRPQQPVHSSPTMGTSSPQMHMGMGPHAAPSGPAHAPDQGAAHAPPQAGPHAGPPSSH